MITVEQSEIIKKLEERLKNAVGSYEITRLRRKLHNIRNDICPTCERALEKKADEPVSLLGENIQAIEDNGKWVLASKSK